MEGASCMNFKDKVNANIPTETEVEAKKLLLLEKDIIEIASRIRQHILKLAKQHTSQQNLVYNGIIFTHGNRFMEIETYRKNSEGLFSNNSILEKYYSLNEYADTFYLGLREELKNDGISISEWKLASLFYDSDTIDYHKIRDSLFLCDSVFNNFQPEIKEGPFPFDSTYKTIYKSKYGQLLGTESTSSCSYYKNKTFFPGFPPYACIFIKFTNN